MVLVHAFISTVVALKYDNNHHTCSKWQLYKTALFYNAQLRRALVLNGQNAKETMGIRTAYTQEASS